MSKFTTVGTLAALMLLTSSVTQADFKAKEKRGTLQVTGTGPGTALLLTDLGDELLVLSLFGSDIVDFEPTQAQTFDSSEITGVSVKLGTHSVAVVLMNGQDVQVKGGGAAEFIFVAGPLGDVNVSSGGGNDYVFLIDAQVYGDTDINTGGGHDICTVNDSAFYGDVDVSLGGGHDELFVNYNSLSSSSDVCFNGGGGDDIAYVEYNDIDLSDFLKKFENEEEEEEDTDEEDIDGVLCP